MTRRSNPSPGMVIWFAGSEIERFPSFREYFLAMVDYNQRVVQRLESGANA